MKVLVYHLLYRKLQTKLVANMKLSLSNVEKATRSELVNFLDKHASECRLRGWVVDCMLQQHSTQLYVSASVFDNTISRLQQQITNLAHKIDEFSRIWALSQRQLFKLVFVWLGV